MVDLLNGLAVHAVGGRRKEYAPVKSVLTPDPDPLSIVLAFENLGLREVYVADLNAIESIGNNLQVIEKLSEETNVMLMVDAGFRRAKEIEPYVERGANKIVMATETLENFEEVRKALDYGRPLVGSIDLKGGRVVASSKEVKRPLANVIQNFEDAGVSEILLLNLDRVGTNVGPNVALIERALRIATVPLLTGGGTRHGMDLRFLQKIGIAGVLVATALHSGRIGREELEKVQQKE